MAYTAIDNPELHFQTKTYTGNGSSGHAITLDGDEDMQPDWVWIKSRSDTEQHTLYDSSRGGSKRLMSDAATAEYDDSDQGLQSFDSDGFTLGENDQNNKSSQNCVAWNWKANGGSEVSVSASGSGITDILASNHQANTTAGFSIVRWTSVNSEAYVSHGLGAVPHCYIVKDRENGSANWMMYHKDTGGDAGMIFNTTAARDVSSFWRNSDAANTGDPTSSIFKLGTQGYTGGHTNDMIAYCWTPIQGYSKFGTYEGNGNANGPFVYTGFKPAFVMIKVSVGNTGGWDMYDNKRAPFNDSAAMLQANASGAEQTSDVVDFLSNGFKIRSTSGNQNGDGNTHIYMAFAEQPFVTSGGVPCTAR